MNNWEKIENRYRIKSLNGSTEGLKKDLSNGVSFHNLHMIMLKSYKTDKESFYKDLEKKDPLSKLDLTIRSNNVYVEKNGFMSYLEINYEGSGNISSNLPEDYHIFKGSKKIVIMLFGSNDCKDHIFSFDGSVDILSAVARGISENVIKCTVNKDNQDEWVNSDTEWDTDSSLWELHKKKSDPIPMINPISVNKNTLLSRAKRVASYQSIDPTTNRSIKTFKAKRKSIRKVIKDKKGTMINDTSKNK